MDDYDEVEVLSDFNFENLFFKAESSLHSNYDSVDLFNTHSSPPGGHWFLESNINTFWSRTLSSDSEDKLSFSSFSTSPQTKFLDSLSIPNNQYNHVWSNKEKYLLEKGLELFGRSWIRLSQYIGSKTSNQIRSYVLSLEQNTEQNLVTIMNPSSSLIDFTELSGTEIINDMQIPASMEEVISAVSTAQPTVPFMSDRYSRRQKLSSQSSSDSESCDSLHSLKVETIECSSKSQSKSKKKRSRFPAKRSKLSLSSRNQKQSKARMKETNVIFIKPKEEVSQFHIKMAESNSNKNFVVLPSGEEVVKIKYESSSDESDIDIDIEDVTGCDAKPLIKIEPEECEYQCNDEKPVKTESDENQSSQPSSSLQKHLKNIREKINAIYELPPPTQERTLNTNGSVSDDEKKFHPEFFMKNDPILINRYIKIRNHIYNTWLTCRPNYVNKTAIRSGLKGDVNLISRIHAYLEQLGYINFGCEQCHYNQQKDPAMSRIDSDKSDDALSLSPTRRTTTRARNKFFSYSSLLDQPTKMDIVDEGGCTIQHINSNETVISCFGSGQIENIKNPVESTVELIPCKSYSESLNVPFHVKMSFETLALVDIHAHSSQDKEVIGLLGGRFDSDASILYISSAIACKTVNSSNIHCDMCPVSQSESSEKLYAMGQDVIGWYHSHPTFLPNPSHQDLETQQSLQTWFSDSAGLPFVGFIISPFLNPEESSASTIRCLKMEVSNDDTMSPFELNVELFFDIESNIHLALFEAIETLLASIPSEFSKDNPILCKDHIQEVLDKWTQIDDEIWAKVIVLERNRRVAKAYARAPVLTVNGSEDGFDGFRIGLCGFDNPMRDRDTEELKKHIGQGVKVKMDEQGNILVKRLSKCNVYVKSTSNGEETSIGADVLKLPNCCLEVDKPVKLFDMKKFQQNVIRELRRAYPDRKRLECQCLSAIAFVKSEQDLLDCPIWVLIINVVAMDMLKFKLPPVKRTVDIRNRPRIPIPDEDPYSVATTGGGSSGSSGSMVAATREQLLRRSDKPPKLPPRDNNHYPHDIPKPDYDDIEEEENRLGGVKHFPLTRNTSTNNNKTKDKKYDDPYYCGLRARIPNFVTSKSKDPSSKTSSSKNGSSMAPRYGMGSMVHPVTASNGHLVSPHAQHYYQTQPQQPHPSMWHARSYDSGMDAELMDSPYNHIYGRLPIPTRGYIPATPRTMYIGEWD